MELVAATEDDAELFFELRNEEGARAASLTKDRLESRSHATWFASKLADPASELWVVHEDGSRVGYVRFDISGREAEISVVIAADHRVRGLGRQAIRIATLDLLQRRDLGTVRATVKSHNTRSLAAFKAAGYRVVEQVRDDGVQELLFSP